MDESEDLPDGLPQLESKVLELASGTLKLYAAKGEPEQIYTWQDKGSDKDIIGTLVHDISTVQESLKRIPALFAKVNECWNTQLPVDSKEISGLIDKAVTSEITLYAPDREYANGPLKVSIDCRELGLSEGSEEYSDYLIDSKRVRGFFSPRELLKINCYENLSDKNFVLHELIEQINRINQLQMNSNAALEIEKRRDFLAKIDSLKSAAMGPLVKIYRNTMSRGVNVQYKSSSEEVLLDEINKIRLGKAHSGAPAGTSSGKGTSQEDKEYQLISEFIDPAKDAQYSEDITHPEETIEFPQGTVKKYLFDENAALYLWLPNDRRYNPQGILRYEVKNIKQSAEQIQKLTRNAFQGKVVSIGRGEYYIPRSLDEITNEIIGSTESKKEFKEKGTTNLELVYDLSDAPVTPAQEFVLKQGGCGHQIKFDSDFFFNLFTTNILVSAGGGALSILLKSFTTLMASTGFAVACGGWFLYSCISPKKSTVQTVSRLLPKIKKELKSLEKITAAYETAKDMNASIKLSERMSVQKEKLGHYWNAMYTALTQKCVSITYTSVSAENIIDYFSRLRKKMKNIAQVPETANQTQLPEPKQTAEAKQNLIPVKTLSKMIVESNWIKDDQYGREIDGRYALKERIGEGGLCRVYKAVRKLDDQEVAIKFEKPEASALREKEELIKTLKSVRHENLIETHDANLHANPAYIVMDLIEGADLGRILEFANATKKYINLENIMCIARQTGEALQALHSNGTHEKVIHNDIKPQNILIDKNGKTYLGDCDVADIAKEIGSMLSQATAEEASGAGTLEYMSPERKSAKKTKIDEKSDIYSFGVVLYEMIAGQVPMTPDGLDSRTDLPEDLKKIVCKCVKVNPKNRYNSMDEVMRELNQVQIKSKPVKLITNYEIKEEQPEPTTEIQPETKEDRTAVRKVLEDRLDTPLKQLDEHVFEANKQMEEVRQRIYKQNSTGQEQTQEKVKEPEQEPANTPESAFANVKMIDADTAPKPEHIPAVIHETAKEPEQTHILAQNQEKQKAQEQKNELLQKEHQPKPGQDMQAEDEAEDSENTDSEEFFNEPMIE